VRAVGPSTAELVVEDDAAPVAQAFEVLEVVVREAGAAVEAEEWHAGAGADAPVPDAPAGDLYVTLLARGGDSTSRRFAAQPS
jgi:hypothetical protein